jgi:hypothetical protein
VSGQINDGGSAFPQPAKHYDDGSSSIPPNNGMSLRDWFAGQALQGHLAFPGSDLYADDAAKIAYRYADAMIAARKGGAK